ncbi:MAG: hypothetical protein HC827_09940 [Cyanobacteria bacterium RM1_2_2]|nr:hypothetical protein [Cyanobacteria bacterium RM1_2_2]
MGRKINRIPLTIILCSVLGVIFGATASQAEMNQCLTEENPTNQCLMQNPVKKRIEGMGMGLFAGAGAAVGATWRMKMKG